MHHLNTLAALGLVAALALSADVSVAAVNLPSTGSLTGSDAVNDALRESTRQAAGRDASARAQPPQGGTLARLDFTPSDAVRSANNQRIVDALHRASPKTDRAKLQALLDSGALQKAFAAVLAKAGLSPTDLADVMTGYLVVAWELVNAQDTTANAEGYAVARNRMRDSLARNPRVAALSDADKQRIAETLGVLIMLSAAERDALKKRGQLDKLPRLQEGVRQSALKLGVDLGKVAFTRNGFLPR